MAQFLDIYSPVIVKANTAGEIPERLHNRHLILINLLNLTDIYKNTESYDDEGSGSSYDPTVNGIPGIYVDINYDFVNNQDGLGELILKGYKDESIFATGTDRFVLGRDYYVNTTLYARLMNIHSLLYDGVVQFVLPDYYTEDFDADSRYWVDLSDSPYKYHVNLEYYWMKNQMLTWKFSEDELNNFYVTFMNIIKNYTLITNETRATGNNPIYEKVIDYYRNFKSDGGSTAIALILNSLYGTSENKTTCGCNADLSESTHNTATCSELYEQAMQTYLVQMLSDHQFYTDWFMIDTENSAEGILPNDVLIDLLAELIREFEELNYNLSFTKTDRRNCECPVVDYNESDCNHKIIAQYLNVLSYASNNTIDANVNKIKIYGKQFAEILPYLIF